MQLAYTDHGTGPIIVLLHGFPLNRSMWDGQTDVLAASYRVIIPDLRGHGDSPAPDGVYEMDSLADDVAELLDGLGVVEPVVLGGLSMGGYVALAFALSRPQRLRGLILADTKAAGDSPEAVRQREANAQKVLDAGSPQPLVEAMIPRLFSRTTLEKRPSLVTPIEQAMMATSPEGVAGALRGMAVRPDRRDRLAEIPTPTLVVVGADDVISPPDEAQAIAKGLPNGRCVVIPKAGHLAPYENPEAFNASIAAFLRDLDAHA